MRIYFYPVVLLFFPLFALAQTKANSHAGAKQLTPRINTLFYKLGDGQLRIRVYQYGNNKDLFFINLHDDEVTAVSAAKRILAENGGTLVKIENNKQRNIRFRLNGKNYAFDPNRIFSRVGIIQTLSKFGRSDMGAINELDKFSKQILQLLPSPPTCIIALHNNTHGNYSITSYLVGREREKDAKAVRIMPAQDPDDLFLTTDSALFRKFTSEKYNAVLQDNVNAYKDGSLSIYCGEKGIRYLNCETEHGKLAQYGEMIKMAVGHIRNPEAETIVYNYQLFPTRDSVRFSQPYEIYFGQKKIGSIQLEQDEDVTGRMTGQMAITKSFPLYDNMDLYYFRSANNDPRIELRIDPTRSKGIHDPSKATITIRIVP